MVSTAISSRIYAGYTPISGVCHKMNTFSRIFTIITLAIRIMIYPIKLFMYGVIGIIYYGTCISIWMEAKSEANKIYGDDNKQIFNLFSSSSSMNRIRKNRHKRNVREDLLNEHYRNFQPILDWLRRL